MHTLPPYRSERRAALVAALFKDGVITDTALLDRVLGLVNGWLDDAEDGLLAARSDKRMTDRNIARMTRLMREISDVLPGDAALAKRIAETALRGEG